MLKDGKFTHTISRGERHPLTGEIDVSGCQLKILKVDNLYVIDNW